MLNDDIMEDLLVDLKEKEREVDSLKLKISEIKEESERFKKKLAIVTDSTTVGMSDSEISELTKKMKVADVLLFLRENYDFAPADLGVIQKIVPISTKTLAEIAVGLKTMNGVNHDDLH